MDKGSKKNKPIRAAEVDNEDHIDPDKKIPNKLVILSAGTHLYSYGIILFPCANKKRFLFYHPNWILFMEVLYFSRSLASLFVPNTNRQYFIYSGDYMYFIHAKTHINIAATQYMMIGISLLIMSFIRYARNNYPVFLRSYDFLAGKNTPSEAGLRNEKYILDLINKARRLINITNMNTHLVCIVSFTMSILPLVTANRVMKDILFYSIPWSLVFAISSYYTFSSYFWHMAYFYILCHLNKYRVKEMNDFAIKINKHPKTLSKVGVNYLRRNYKSIAHDVKLYNDTYWSKVLFLIIVSLATFNNSVLYSAMFVDMQLVVTVSLYYANCLSMMAIFFVLNTASIVYQESTRSRLLMNSLYVSVSMHKTLDYRSRFKVCNRIIQT